MNCRGSRILTCAMAELFPLVWTEKGPFRSVPVAQWSDSQGNGVIGLKIWRGVLCVVGSERGEVN